MAWQIGFCLFVFITGIFQSHKIAGPIYKVRLMLKEIIQGSVPQSIKFRDGDHFPELAEDLTSALQALHEKKNQDYLFLEDVEKYLEEISTHIPEENKGETERIYLKRSIR